MTERAEPTPNSRRRSIEARVARPLGAALLALPLVVALGSGCSNDAAPERRAARHAAPTRGVPVEAAPAGPQFYDAEGNLRASEASFLGFPIPVGFERVHAVDGIFVYASREVPYAKLGSYVEARITAATPEAVGRSGLIYERVRVRGAEDSSRLLQVRVMQTRDTVQLWLRDATPVVFPPGTTEASRIEEVNRAWREERE